MYPPLSTRSHRQWTKATVNISINLGHLHFCSSLVLLFFFLVGKLSKQQVYVKTWRQFLSKHVELAPPTNTTVGAIVFVEHDVGIARFDVDGDSS